jgi:type VI secretion system protein ImpK
MKLYDATADLFLYLTTFRRRARKALPVAEAEVRAKFDELISLAAARAESDPRLGGLWDRARYALAVLADEIALDSDWAGRATWESALIEQKYFGTTVGGVRFFDILDEIPDHEPELAEVFFLCLALGFRGKYAEGAPELESFKRKLLAKLPGRVADDETRLTPAAYHVVEGSAKGSPVVNLVRVAIACGVLVLVYVVMSQVLFYVSVSSIHRIAETLTR